VSGEHAYAHPRPAVTADVVVLATFGARLRVLLIRRKNEPFRGRWALPGGYVDQNEDLPDAALRELEEETGLRGLPISQIGAFGKPGRDPRGHTVSVAFLAIAPEGGTEVRAGDDAGRARWAPLHRLPSLAFDHAAILAAALGHLETLRGDPSRLLPLLPASFDLEAFARLANAAQQARAVSPREGASRPARRRAASRRGSGSGRGR